jgi:DNA-binding protein YbaB
MPDMKDIKDINIEEVLAKATEMQSQFQDMQKNFTKKEIVGMAGAEDADKIFVKAKLDGMRMVKSLDVGEGAWAQARSVLLELIITAVNNATDKLNDVMQTEVKKIYSAPGMLPEGEQKKTDETETDE